MKILIAGLGNIGASLARVAIGKFPGQVGVWNRSIEKGELLFQGSAVQHHYQNFTTIEEAITNSDVVVLSLADYSVAYKALSQTEDLSEISETSKLLANKIVIQLASSLPSESVQWKQFIDKAGGINVDGCVIGWPSFVGTEKFSILVSGCTEETFDKVKPLLDVWGRAILVGGLAGQADALDMGVLTFLQGIKFGFMQGLALCAQADVPIDKYLDLSVNYLRAYEGVVKDTATRVSKSNYTENINTSVEVLHKFNRGVLKHAEQTGTSTELLHAVDAPLTALVDAGKGKLDQVACYEYMLNRNSDFFKQ